MKYEKEDMSFIRDMIGKIKCLNKEEEIEKFKILEKNKNKIYNILFQFGIFYKIIKNYYKDNYVKNKDFKINFSKISTKRELGKIVELIDEMFLEKNKENKLNYRRQIYLHLNKIDTNNILKENFKTTFFEYIKNSNNPKYKIIKDLYKIYNDNKTIIAQNNYKLVYHLYKIWKVKTICRTINDNDIFNSGMIGLLKSIDLFDFKRRIKFSCFCNWYINSNIQIFVYNANTVINRTLSYQNKLFIVNKAKQELIKNDKPVTLKNIAEITGFKEKNINNILKYDNKQVDIDKEDIKDFLVSKDNLFSIIDNNSDSNYILELFENLSFRDREILKLYFGFENNTKMTLENIGKIFSVSRERVRQIIEKNLKYLSKLIEVNKYKV